MTNVYDFHNFDLDFRSHKKYIAHEIIYVDGAYLVSQGN